MKTKELDNHSEAKIINIKDYAEYNERLSEIMKTVNDLTEEIHESLFNLACLDKWKEWDANQEVGAEIFVTDDMLRNTGDKNIDLLWKILDKIMDVKEKICKT